MAILEGRTNVGVYGMQPASVFEETFQVDYKDPTTGLSLIEQLYTARGSQGSGAYSREMEPDA